MTARLHCAIVRVCALFLWAATAGVAHAAETPAAPANPGTNTSPDERTAAQDTANPDTPDRPLSGSEARRANDKGGVFRPSEDISEDLAVTFPVDI